MTMNRIHTTATSIAAALVAVLGLADARAQSIGAIQGESHVSPLVGTAVSNVLGIVTRTVSNGFFMQDGGDGNARTSDGIFVFTSSAPAVAVGDQVSVSGGVTEFRAGCTPSCADTASAFNNLTVTQIQRIGSASAPTTPLTVSVLSSANALPGATILGAGGLAPLGRIGTNFPNAAGIEGAGYAYNPALNAIDQYESLESMRVTVKDAVAVGPTNNFGELPVLVDNGAGAALRSARGGVAVGPGSFNGDRIILDDRFIGSASMPKAKVGDRLGDVTGVMDYNFANYKLDLTEVPSVIDGGLTKESAPPPKPGQLSIASFNVENLAGNSSAAKFAGIASQIVNNLKSPDIIGLSEIQDNNGTTDNGVVSASETYAKLIAAIQAAGGPTYAFRSIDPVNNSDGGAPGANIRVGFLYNPATATFVDKPGGDATTPVGVGPDGLPTSSPGRIDADGSAWTTGPSPSGAKFGFEGTRKPLVGEFIFNGKPIIVVVNHLKSKTQDEPLFGRFQDPTQFTAEQRIAQAKSIAAFLEALLAADPDAPIVLLGDYNDFEFSASMAEIIAAGVKNLYDLLPEGERYSYVFDGNSQALDHILTSPWMTDRLAHFDVVHMNSEFPSADRFSDHDALLAVFDVAVPVPATTPLLLAGLAALLHVRRRAAPR